MGKKKVKITVESVEKIPARTKIYSREFTGYLEDAPQEVIDKLNERKNRKK
jgi:hypothetical protein